MNEGIEIAIHALIKPFEGYAKRLPNGDCIAYPDPATGGEPWTIGYGSTGSGISAGTMWSKDQAEERLQEHVEYFSKGLVGLSPSLLQASCSMANTDSFTRAVIGRVRSSPSGVRRMRERYSPEMILSTRRV